MAKNKPIYHMRISKLMERSTFYLELSIDLCPKHVLAMDFIQVAEAIVNVQCYCLGASLLGWQFLKDANTRKQNVHEPPHDKTNKMTYAPNKTQISLDIHPV